MKTIYGAALRAALLCGAGIAVSACVYDRPYDRDYGYRTGGAGYYEDDPCDRDHSYCGYPAYEGGVYVEGNWYDGRHRYRDQDGRREYWVHGGWHAAESTRDGNGRGDRDHMNGGDRGDRGDRNDRWNGDHRDRDHYDGDRGDDRNNDDDHDNMH